MKQYKDEDILYYTIKIRRIREVKGDKNDREYKDKLWCVNCNDFLKGETVFCDPTLKKAFKTLQEELHLN